jgi:RimJ/RimL family protein N-acetyltransferase
MLVELPAGAREPLRPLFQDFKALHGTWEAALSANFGSAVADDAARPTAALVILDFYFLAGDASAHAAGELVARISPPASIAVSGHGWEPLLRECWGDRLQLHERVAFEAAPSWDRARLRAQASALPAGFSMVRVDAPTVAAFGELDAALVYNFPSHEVFLRDGVGFGVLHEGRFVAGCSSFTIGGGKLEFEIDTHPDFRQRDLATATGARMIEHCLDNGLEPCWDAHNPPSAALATKLGFVNPLPYWSYYLR